MQMEEEYVNNITAEEVLEEPVPVPAETELEELKKKHLYELAELQNSFKRRLKTAEFVADHKIENLILDILEPVDDLERVLLHLSNVLSAEDLTGISHVYKKILGILRNVGCEQVNADKGIPFDTDIHEAVATETAEEPGFITAVHQNGYTYNGRLIRSAKVTVSTTE